MSSLNWLSSPLQIDRQLTAYMKRVEDVLGRGWENHVEGQKLKADGDSFRAKLNTQVSMLLNLSSSSPMLRQSKLVWLLLAYLSSSTSDY
jgi:hypothetical protein